MANPRGAPLLRRLPRSPISRCACLLVLSIRQVARVNLPRRTRPTRLEMLETKEIEKFDRHASQVVAFDYIIFVESDVFVPSHSGNMVRAVEGYRRFLCHRKTITPDRRGLVELFDLLEKGELTEGPKLSSLVTETHKYKQGAPRKRYGFLPGSKGRGRLRTEESFYEIPFTECICLNGNH